MLNVLVQYLYIAHAFDVKIFVGTGGHLKGGQTAVLFRKTYGFHDPVLDGLAMCRGIGDDANLFIRLDGRADGFDEVPQVPQEQGIGRTAALVHGPGPHFQFGQDRIGEGMIHRSTSNNLRHELVFLGGKRQEVLMAADDLDPVVAGIALHIKAQVLEHFQVAINRALRGFQVPSNLFHAFGRFSPQIADQLEDPQNPVLI